MQHKSKRKCPGCGNKKRYERTVNFLISKGLLKDEFVGGERGFSVTDMCRQLFKQKAEELFEKLRLGHKKTSYINTCDEAIVVASFESIVSTLKPHEKIEEIILMDSAHVLSNIVRLMKGCEKCQDRGKPLLSLDWYII